MVQNQGRIKDFPDSGGERGAAILNFGLETYYLTRLVFAVNCMKMSKKGIGQREWVYSHLCTGIRNVSTD